MLTTDTATSAMITITIDGKEYRVPAGISVAAAILGKRNDPGFCRSRPEIAENSEPRSPYCLMGVCFDCLAEIDGLPNRQTCLTTVEQGMIIRRQLQENGPKKTGKPDR